MTKMDQNQTPSQLSSSEGTWRSLEELAGTPEFEEKLHREFPRHAGGMGYRFGSARFPHHGGCVPGPGRVDRLHQAAV